MKLKLIQTGGFAGLRKSCEKEMDLTPDDIEDLVKSLAPKDQPNPDSLSHTLVIDEKKRIEFSPDATHGKWKPTIEEMMASLEYERYDHGQN